MDFLQSNTSSKVLKSIVKVKKDQAWGDQKFSIQESIAKVSSLKSLKLLIIQVFWFKR